MGRLRIEAALSAHAGYSVERIVLDEETQAISATKVRNPSSAP
jgi:hypothetical protein